MYLILRVKRVMCVLAREDGWSR